MRYLKNKQKHADMQICKKFNCSSIEYYKKMNNHSSEAVVFLDYLVRTYTSCPCSHTVASKHELAFQFQQHKACQFNHLLPWMF